MRGVGAREPSRACGRARRRGRPHGREPRPQAAADDPLREAAPQLLARPRVARDDQPCARLARALDGDRGAAGRDQALPGEEVNDELIALEQGLADAIRRSDAEAASRFIAEDFVLSSTGGVSPHMPRGDWLAALAELETRSLAPEVVDSRSFGDVT